MLLFTCHVMFQKFALIRNSVNMQSVDKILIRWVFFTFADSNGIYCTLQYNMTRTSFLSDEY